MTEIRFLCDFIFMNSSDPNKMQNFKKCKKIIGPQFFEDW